MTRDLRDIRLNKKIESNTKLTNTLDSLRLALSEAKLQSEKDRIQTIIYSLEESKTSIEAEIKSLTEDSEEIHGLYSSYESVTESATSRDIIDKVKKTPYEDEFEINESMEYDDISFNEF